MPIVRMSQIIIFKVKKTVIKAKIVVLKCGKMFVFYRITCQKVEKSNIINNL